jgi:hypothetical protein
MIVTLVQPQPLKHRKKKSQRQNCFWDHTQGKMQQFSTRQSSAQNTASFSVFHTAHPTSPQGKPVWHDLLGINTCHYCTFYGNIVFL